jgi:hypothetical protein
VRSAAQFRARPRLIVRRWPLHNTPKPLLPLPSRCNCLATTGLDDYRKHSLHVRRRTGSLVRGAAQLLRQGREPRARSPSEDPPSNLKPDCLEQAQMFANGLADGHPNAHPDWAMHDQPVDTRAPLHRKGVDGSSPSGALQKRRTSALSRSGQLAPGRTCRGYGARCGALWPERRNIEGGSPSGSHPHRVIQPIGWKRWPAT